MAIDLTKIAFHSGYPAFKNNQVYTGSFSITGSTTGGANVRTFDVTLDNVPDLLDVSFRGNSAASDPRPDAAWFHNGYIWVPTDNSQGGNPSNWYMSYAISGNTVTITASYLWTVSAGESLTTTPFDYKIVDYSVF